MNNSQSFIDRANVAVTASHLVNEAGPINQHAASAGSCDSIKTSLFTIRGAVLPMRQVTSVTKMSKHSQAADTQNTSMTNSEYKLGQPAFISRASTGHPTMMSSHPNNYAAMMTNQAKLPQPAQMSMMNSMIIPASTPRSYQNVYMTMSSGAINGANPSKVRGAHAASSFSGGGKADRVGSGPMQQLGSAAHLMRAMPMQSRGRSTVMQAVATAESVASEPQVKHLTKQIHYPTDLAPRGDDQDTYGDNVVHDPYRWLENPDAPETKVWVDKQNEITEEYLSSCELRDKISDKLTEVWDFPKIGLINKHGDHYYFLYNSGLNNQSVQYRIKEKNSFKLDPDDILSGTEEFLDPNQLSEDGTAALGGKSWSEDGKHLAYQVNRAGSDWATIYVRSVETGKDLEDEIPWVKFSSISWTHDNKGFFYSRFDAPESLKKDTMDKAGVETDKLQKQQVWYHRLGTKADEDVFIYSNDAQPDWMNGGSVTNDGRYLMISSSRDTGPRNLVQLVDLEAEGIKEYLSEPYSKDKACPIKPMSLVDDWIGGFSYIHNKGPLFYFKTNHNAPFSKVIEMDISKPQVENWREVIPEMREEKKVLKSCICANGRILTIYQENAADKLRVYDFEEKAKMLHEIQLPDIGTVASVDCKHDSDEMFFMFTSFTDPGSSYRVDMNNYEMNMVTQTKLSENSPDISQFVTDQIWYKSKDGTEVPMFVVRKKSTLASVDDKPEEPIPTILYGYGGFNVSITPSFSPARLVFLNNLNGMLCVASIRGGGEFGEEWHQDGIKDKKQNGLDDFIAAAEFIQNEKGYTDSQSTIINGGSNGGMLVTAVANQRPDLFGAVIGQVPVTDMLRFHKFTIGHFWIADYGCAEQDAFDYLIKYSPLHTIKEEKYPATMILTGDHDDRVVPLHTYKYIAELQHKAGHLPGQSPLLARVDIDSGHGAGMPTSKIIAQTTDVYSMMAKVSGAKWTE